MKITYNFQGDYKEKLREIIKDKRDWLREIGHKSRAAFIIDLIEQYIEQVGERPDHSALYQLGSIYLYDHLEGDTRRNKTKVDEYPVLTENQLEYRRTGDGRARSADTGVTYREVGYINAVNIGTDGADYSLPIRRYD